MTTMTSNILVSEAISSDIQAKAIALAWILVENPHAINKMLEEDVLLFEFVNVLAAEKFVDAAIDYINCCTKHTAEVGDQSCKVRSFQWAIETTDVYLPTIEVCFADTRQREGLLLTDVNGKPYGILVIDCDDEEAHLIDTVIRF